MLGCKTRRMKLAFGTVGLGLTAVLVACGPGHAAGPGGDRGSRPVGKVVADTAAPADSSAAIFLSWGAPYGTPGARNATTPSCDDSTATDTLYLTFDPGRDQAHLIGFDANLIFHAAPGDTLEPFWGPARTGPLPRNLRVEYEDPPDGVPWPWGVQGKGTKRYRKAGDTAELVLVYFVPADEAGPVVGGTRYFLARVILRHRPPAPGCGRPVCVGLARLKPSYGPGSPWITTGEQVVTWNSPGGAACTEYRLELEALLHPAAPDTTRKGQ